MKADAVVVTLLFLVPGYIALRCIRRAASNPALGEWAQTLWSLALSAIGYVVASLMPHADPVSFFMHMVSTEGVAREVLTIQSARGVAFGWWWTLFVGVVSALCIESQWFRELWSRATEPTIIESPWNKLFVALRHWWIMVEVERVDGQRFAGNVQTVGTERDDRTIILEESVRTVDAAGRPVAEPIGDAGVLCIPGDQIRSVTVVETRRVPHAAWWWIARVGAVTALLGGLVAIHLGLPVA